MRTFKLAADHPVIADDTRCRLCELPFKAGDDCVLVPLPPSNDEAIAKMKQGRPYTAEAMLTHLECARTVRDNLAALP